MLIFYDERNHFTRHYTFENARAVCAGDERDKR
jgi:hypothetical protein